MRDLPRDSVVTVVAMAVVLVVMAVILVVMVVVPVVMGVVLVVMVVVLVRMTSKLHLCKVFECGLDEFCSFTPFIFVIFFFLLT
jgi:hypothetical protein